MALIRGTGARLSILDDHRLVDLWREYSARQYRGGWIAGNREEVFRFVTWSNHHARLGKEIAASLRLLARRQIPDRLALHRRALGTSAKRVV